MDMRDFAKDNKYVNYFSDCFSYIPGGVFVYRASGDEEILYANRYVIELFECGSPEEFITYTGGSFKGMVHADDLDKVEHTIWSQIRTSDNQFDHVKYRIKTKKGTIKHIDDYGRLFEDPKEGQLFFVFVIDENKSNSGSYDELTGFPGENRFKDYVDSYINGPEMMVETVGLMPTRPAVVYFNTTGFKFFNVRYGMKAGDEYLKTTAKCIMEEFRNCFISRFSADHFAVFCDDEDVMKKTEGVLRKMNALRSTSIIGMKAGIFYIDKYGETADEACEKAAVACEYIKTDKSSDVMVYTEEVGNSVMANLGSVQFDDKEILTAFAQEYLVVFEVDLRRKRLSTYKYYATTDPSLDVAVSGGDYEEIQRVFADTMVSDEDRRRVFEHTDAEYIRSQLRLRRSFSTIYRAKNNMFVEIKIIRADSGAGEPGHIVIGFANRTDEMVDKLSYSKPIASIENTVKQAMGRITDPDATRKYLEKIQDSVKELKNLIDGE